MKTNLSMRCAIPVWLTLGSLAAEEPPPAPAAVQGIKGVKEDAVSTVKHVETGNAAPSGGVTTGAKNDAQAVNKVNGVQTINGVKEDGRTIVPPTAPPPPPTAVPPPPPHGVEPPPPTAVQPPPPHGVQPPPPPTVHQAGSIVAPAGGSVGTAATIQSVKGVTGLNTAKVQNLEAALNLKHAAETPAGTGAEKGGKGKAAAAGLLAAPLERPDPKAPKQDGRAGFQEFEKLQVNGS